MRRTEVLQVALIVLMFAFAAAAWPFVPDRIPVHWNAAGEIDRHGGKLEGLFLLPAIAVGLYLLFRVLPRIDPHRANYAGFAKAFQVFRAATILLLAVLHSALVLFALGVPLDIPLIVPIAVGSMFCVLGILMDKLRPNWFIGVRTPWTLSSDDSWTKTHRLGSKLFIAMGLIFTVAGVARSAWTIYAILGLIAAVILWLTVYSYVVWKRDPHRRPPSAREHFPDRHEGVPPKV